jgi:hypothetical protein
VGKHFSFILQVLLPFTRYLYVKRMSIKRECITDFKKFYDSFVKEILSNIQIEFAHTRQFNRKDVPDEICNDFLQFKLSVVTVFANCVCLWSPQKVFILIKIYLNKT